MIESTKEEKILNMIQVIEDNFINEETNIIREIMKLQERLDQTKLMRRSIQGGLLTISDIIKGEENE